MKNILVVEDELEIRQLLANYLRNEGFSVSEAEDGVAAIELFGKEKFDLVILDILIPKIDGYGVCELIKSKSDVPVIFLSALGDERSMIKGYDSFADALRIIRSSSLKSSVIFTLSSLNVYCRCLRSKIQ